MALVFALLHGTRSAWGLWQLYVFRLWCAESIKALAAMGVTFSFSDTEQCQRARKNNSSAWEMSDEVLLNNSIVDNQLLHGDTVCHIQYGDHVHLRAPALPDDLDWMSVTHFLRACCVFLRNALICMSAMLLESVRFSIGLGTSGNLRQVPNRPTEVWINWSIAFAAQGLREWMSEFSVSTDPTVDQGGNDHNRKGVNEWTKRTSYFASEVLSTCIMQLWPELEGAEDKKMEPMLWSGLGDESVMSSGRMVKQEPLKNAMESGYGLPFGVAHEPIQDDREDGKRHIGYSAFSRQLFSKIGDLGVRKEFCSETEKLDVEMLEWLTILLYMGRRSLKLRKERSQNQGQYEERETDTGSFGNDDASVLGDDSTRNAPLDQATRNLAEQLSCVLRSETQAEVGKTRNDGEQKSIVPSFPLSQKWRTEKSAKNRHVLKVGEVVDVWLSTVAGDGLRFLLKLNEKWSDLCRGVACGDSDISTCAEDPNRSGHSGKDDESMEKSCCVHLQKVHKEMEKLRLRYQFGDDDCLCEWGMNYGMTFMGYRMEEVRSHLAEWAYKLENERSNVRKCSSEFREGLEDLNDGVYKTSVPFIFSNALSRALQTEHVTYTLTSRQFHVRLIWELQEHFAKCIQDERECEDDSVSKRSRERYVAIALCALSFPSVSVQVREEHEVDYNTVTKTSDWWGIPVCCHPGEQGTSRTATDDMIDGKVVVIEPVLGPQCLRIEVRFLSHFTDERRNATVSLCFEDMKEFVWEWWRDAFTGRLEGLKEWQAEHYMESSLEVIPSSGPMGTAFDTYKTVTDERFEVWEGWRPYRVEFCLFEVRRSGLLKAIRRVQWQQSRSITLGTFALRFGFSRHERRVVSYQDAELRVLSHVMSLIREAIREAIREGSGITESEKEKGSESRKASMGQDLVRNAEDLSRMASGEVERVLLLYEAAAGEFGNKEALEKGVELILRSESVSDMQAMDMLEKFVGCITPPGVLTESRISSDALFALEGVVLETCEKLVCQGGVSMAFTPLFGMLLLVAGFGEMAEKQVARSLMEVVLCCSEKFDALEGYAGFYSMDRQSRSTSTCRSVVGAVSEKKSSLNQKLGKQGRRAEDRCRTAGHADSFENDVNLSAQDSRYEKELLERACRRGRSVDAMVNLGNLLVDGAEGVGVDAVRGMKLYERVIEEGGNVYAMVNLGHLLVDGAEGVVVDAVRAMKLYERAIEEGGDVNAMVNLGILLVKGAEGVGVDAVRGMKLYERAIEEGGDVGAMYNLGNLLVDGAEGVGVDAVRGMKLYERAIEEGGHVNAMFNLGKVLVDGAEGVGVDAARGKSLWECAVDRNGEVEPKVEAMVNLGIMLLNGVHGISMDVERGMSLLERGIEEGEDVNAMVCLGFLLGGVNGTGENATLLRNLFERAKKKSGRDFAVGSFEKLLARGTQGVPQDVERGRALIERAKEAVGM